MQLKRSCRLLPLVVGLLALTVLFAAPAAACPVCATDTGIQVRQGIFDERFWRNALLLLLPFPVYLGLAVTLYHGLSANGIRASPP
ncbi:MAG: hypothetical protein ACK47B_17040 [Armatimonadota bacterium]